MCLIRSFNNNKMPNTKIFTTLLCALCLICNLSYAKVRDFTIKVESSTDSNIRQDIEQAFQQVMKNLHTPQPTAKQPYEQFANTIEEYEYIHENHKPWLHIKFNSKSTLEYLEKNNLLPPPPLTPDTLLLVAQKDGSNNQLLDLETHGFLLNTIIEEANQISLKLVPPNMDIADIELIHFDDVWLHNVPSLKAITARYQTPNLLLLQIQKKGEALWQFNWQLYKGEIAYEGALSGSSIVKLAKQTLERVDLETRSPSFVQNIRLQLSLINSQNTYQDMLLFIKKIPGVQNVKLDGVTQGSVFYTLDTIRDKNSLIKHLNEHKNITNIRVLS